MEPRLYQNDCIDAVELGFKTYRKQLVVAPTGSGKTIVFSFLAKRLLDATGKRTLILANRDELVAQAVEKLRSATGIFADKEKAECNARHSAQVVVASIQTMVRRLDKWSPDHFGLVIVDEADLSITPSWMKALNHFDSFANILGVTATAYRTDQKSLSSYYENVAYEIPLLELVKQGYLCPITIKSLPVRIDLSSVGIGARNDLDETELGHALEPYLDEIALQIKKNAGDRKTLCFLPLISTSNKFVEACLKSGLTAEHVDGESPDRADKLKRFERGDFQLLSNAQLVVRGWDCPPVSCVAMLRATKSWSMFVQAAGRGTRLFDGKENLLILDPLWLHTKHDICRPACLVATSQEEADVITQIADERSALPADVAEQMPIDLIGLVSETQGKREEALRKKFEALRNRKAKFISAEEFALQHHSVAIAEFEPTMRWHSEPVTPGQAKYIEKAGIDITTVKNKGQASAILDTYFKKSGSQPAARGTKWLMKQSGWRSKDNQRGPWQANMQDQRDFYASRPRKPKVSKAQSDFEGLFK
jgi:superfamily II DNA or RNA helicase